MTPPNELNGPRTHEPSLRELTAQLDDLKEMLQARCMSLQQIMDERDRLYDVRFRAAEAAVGAALSAQEKQTAASFAASEKAIVKAEEAQKAYNTSHNDLLRKMDDQIPRTEYSANAKTIEGKFEDVKKEISGLRESRSEGGGKSVGMREVVAYVIAAISIILAILGYVTHFI